MINSEHLRKALFDYLPRQRWFAADEVQIGDITIARLETLRDGVPGLVWVLADVTTGAETARYQILAGVRHSHDEPDFLRGKGHLVLGELETEHGSSLVYGGLADPELAIAFLQHILPGEQVARVRALNVEQSNTSVVYDDRLIMKVFRRIADGPNPDTEVTRALAAVGFDAVAAPVGEWRVDGADYAVVNTFLYGASEGWQLALTSLRDLYDLRCPPEEAGGDFAPEARRLGEVTAKLHLAMAEAFGRERADTGQWADDMDRQLARVSHPAVDGARIGAVYRRLAALAEPGPAIRVHGDYHLAQVMRTDIGWYVLDFEGEPARPLEERRRPSSPLRDVAGMLRSYQYAAHFALREQGSEADEELVDLASQWERRNRGAFCDGYFGTEGITSLLPPDERSTSVALGAFELDKAVYEIAYEIAHRPEWVGIPLEAVDRILEEQP